jgi:23S rRNA (guanosine2251-2'-O)-methyltransferase
MNRKNQSDKLDPMHTEAHVILENVRSSQNVGAILRTSDAIGVSKVWMVGYTPAPIDRYGREVPDVLKTALGAEKTVTWEQREEGVSLIDELKQKGFRIVVVEKQDRATDYKQCEVRGPIALIFGNEVDGVSKEACERADDIISLPMRGSKESLNVATTAGIVLYRLLDY